MQHGGEGTAQDAINDVHVAVRGHQVRLDNGRVDATALHRNRLIIVVTGHHVEVKESLVVVCRDLGDLEVKVG